MRMCLRHSDNNQHVLCFSIESGSSDSPPTMKRPSPTPNKPMELGEGKVTRSQCTEAIHTLLPLSSHRWC